MKKITKWLCPLALFFVFLPHFSGAQKTAVYTDKYKDYREALELYDKAFYSAAQEKFEKIILAVKDPHDEVQINSEYYSALCALHLFHPDAEYMLQEFIERHPESPQVKTVYLHLGRHFYNNKKYKKAIEYFEKVDRFNLTTEELSEYYFKMGYCYFMQKDNKNAMLAFSEIKNTENDYRDPALYYYSHISYTEKSYQVALEGFEKLKTSETFKSLVPYYIAQVYYLQEKYEMVTQYAPPLLDSADEKKKPELSRIIGDSYYRLMKYDIAVPYLEKYFASVTPTREENYQMGYAYYRSGIYAKAIPCLNKATNAKDEMGQLAYYHMAECYLRTNQKEFARNAYEGAAKSDVNKDIQEDAMFSYAKLAYELSYNPFHEAIDALQKYLVKYPNSKRKEEAYSFLVNVYLTTGNYQSALAALDQVKNKDFKMQTAYQMVTFNNGVNLYRNGKYKEAVAAFENVKTYPIDKRLNSESRYWIAECSFQMKEYDKAISLFENFQKEPGAFSSKYYNLANYNVAYAWYEKGMNSFSGSDAASNGDFDNSLYTFKKFVSDSKESDKAKLCDAHLRIGDIYYIKKQNENAIASYQSALSLQAGSNDYALYQASVCYGFSGKYNEQVNGMKKLVNDYPNSRYVPEAIYHTAEGYNALEDHKNAITYYQKYITQYPLSHKVRDALMSMGLIHYHDKNYADAEKMYRRVLAEYKTAEDIRAALEGIKPVLTEQGRTDEYIALVKQYDKGGESNKEIENTMWEVVNGAYEKKECDKVIEGANKYLQQFPEGGHALPVHFFRGECNYVGGRHDLSIPDYEYVLAQTTNSYTEYATMRMASISYKKKEYALAKTYYESLEKMTADAARKAESQLALMRCYYQLKEYTNALAYADIVLKDLSIKDELKAEANLVAGVSLVQNGNYTDALNYLKKTITLVKNKMWAEARYNIAYIYYMQEDHKKCEKEIFDFVKVKPNYDYWLAKAYILLADNYLALGDPAQAKATLKSVIDNYTANDDIVPAAKAKYDAIIEQENQQNNKRMIEDSLKIIPGTEETEETNEEKKENENNK